MEKEPVTLTNTVFEEERIYGTQGSKKQRNYKLKEKIFLFVMLIYPTIQFLIFYFGVNFNSFLLSVQSFDGEKYYFSGLHNYKQVFEDIFVNGVLSNAFRNSAIQFILNLFIALPLHVFVAYCIWKKIPFAGAFKVILFLPNMISTIVWVLIGRYLIEYGIPALLNNPDMPSLLSTMDFSGFYTVTIYNMWLTFAGGMVIYLGAMSSISIDMVEYGKLENMNFLQEFYYLVVPSIFPTITTYIVTGIAGFFTNYGLIFSFFGGASASNTIDTLGYYFFIKVAGESASASSYPYASAGGLLFTLIVTPMTLLVKWLLEKYGPSED